MGRRPGESKQRMLVSAVALLRERGAAGVTVDAVLARSGAPRGSVYHHFPGGRNQLILAAVRQAGDFITASIPEDGSPRLVVERFADFWRQTLRDTDYLAGCPIVALAVDSRPDLPEAARLVGEIFNRWQQKLAELLMADGVPGERAGRLATLVVAAIEGAVILCRAQRDAAPLDDVLTELTPLLDR
ncbi:MAG: TetR/AcrR family transcriptional regulator [Micromonosporaceae bacterium]